MNLHSERLKWKHFRSPDIAIFQGNLAPKNELQAKIGEIFPIFIFKFLFSEN